MKILKSKWFWYIVVFATIVTVAIIIFKNFIAPGAIGAMLVAFFASVEKRNQIKKNDKKIKEINNTLIIEKGKENEIKNNNNADDIMHSVNKRKRAKTK